MNQILAKAKEAGCGGESHRNLFSFIACGVFAVFLQAGCEKAEDGIPQRSENVVAIEVNDIRLSQEDVGREIAFREALVKICRPKTDIKKARRQLESTITNNLVCSLLFESAAERAGIHGTTAITNLMLSNYSRTFARGKGKSLIRLEAALSKEGLGEVYTNNLEREICREAYFDARHGNELRITEKDVDEAVERIRRFDEVAAATNALAYAKATNLWMRIKSGEDFAALADKESEDPDRQPGGELGECEKVDFDSDPGYWEKVSVLKAGEVSEIITTDVGIEIVKALTSLAPSEDTDAPALKLARIYIRRPMFHAKMTRDEIYAELETQARKDVAATSFAEVSSNAVIRINGIEMDFSPKTWRLAPKEKP